MIRMSRCRPAWLLAAGLTILVPAHARASGYSIFEQGAQALGRGGAVTASANNAEAVFFNPANLVWLDRGAFSLNPTLLSPVTSFAGHNPYPGFGTVEAMKKQNFPTLPAYVGYRFAERCAGGIGVAFPFGLGVEWDDPDQFSGRYIVTKAELQSAQVLGVVAYAPRPNLSLAAGGAMAMSKVELQRRRLATAPGGGGAQVDVAKVGLESDFTPGFGWNAAATWKLDPKWTWAATYRSKIVTHMEGDATFQQVLTGNSTFDAGVAAQLPPNQKVKTVIRFPAMWSTGFAWTPTDRWTVEADLNFFEWSVFKDLPLHFQTTSSANSAIAENYDDAFQVRVGAEHRLDRYTYRVGYYYDEAAAPDESMSPLLPDSGRNGVTLGLGFPFGKDGRWSLDLYELAVFVQHRGTEGVNRDGFNGEYKSYVNAAGLGLNYRW